MKRSITSVISLYKHIFNPRWFTNIEKIKRFDYSLDYLNLHPLRNKLKQKYTIQKSYLFCKPKFNHRYALSSLSNSTKLQYVLTYKENNRNLMDLTLTPYLDLIISNEDVKFSTQSRDVPKTILNYLFSPHYPSLKITIMELKLLLLVEATY